MVRLWVFDALWSYFNPRGWGNMALSAQSAQSAQKPVPAFWAIDTLDPLHGAASTDMYQKLPARPDRRYLVVRANHANTPELAAEDLLVWVLARTGR
jgi:hypothetical protein